jgi:hypothetical protein
MASEFYLCKNLATTSIADCLLSQGRFRGGYSVDRRLFDPVMDQKPLQAVKKKKAVPTDRSSRELRPAITNQSNCSQETCSCYAGAAKLLKTRRGKFDSPLSSGRL